MCKHLRLTFAFSQCARRQVTLLFILNSAGIQMHIHAEDQTQELAPDEYRHWQTLARKLIKDNIFEDLVDDFFTI